MLLESDSPPVEELRRILADIRSDDVRASETIRRIRMLIRKREMQMELFEMNEVAIEAMRFGANGGASTPNSDPNGIHDRADYSFCRSRPSPAGADEFAFERDGGHGRYTGG